MAKTISTDPRSQRTRTALQKALHELLQYKPLSKIAISDITDRAGIARHTFYNHYDTKADLLNYLVDSVLDSFFSNLADWDPFLMDPDRELTIYTNFFKAWKDNPDIIRLLKIPEMELVFIDRLKVFFTCFYHQRVKEVLPEANLAFANYVISFNAYSLVGLLIAWLDAGMVVSPEHLGGFFLELSGARNRLKTIQIYQGLLSG